MNKSVNKLIIVSIASIVTTMFVSFAASAYDVFSYRYDYTKQSGSHDADARNRIPSGQLNPSFRINDLPGTATSGNSNSDSQTGSIVKRSTGSKPAIK